MVKDLSKEHLCIIDGHGQQCGDRLGEGESVVIVKGRNGNYNSIKKLKIKLKNKVEIKKLYMNILRKEVGGNGSYVIL